MRSHNCVISAVNTERFGSFLNVDLEPRVAASLFCEKENIVKLGLVQAKNNKQTREPHHRRPKPLSLLASNSGVKNMVNYTESRE
jgi:hypothetical protein